MLACIVEQWREDGNERRQAIAALNLVRAELVQNLAELKAVKDSRPTLLEGYMNAMKQLHDESVSPADLPYLVAPEITGIAYELATDSGAVTNVAPEKNCS
ncbi:MAG: hypothetical protein AAFX44_02190 [Pseudomonadota bacterium]